MSVIAKKICIIGDFSVGKTSLIRRFVDRQFSDQYLSTVGAKISCKVVELPVNHSTNKKIIKLLIWDVEGKTKFKSIAPAYLQGAKGGIIVADLSRQETIDHIQEHIELISSINPKGVSLILALNKSDIIDKQELERLSKTNLITGSNKFIGTYMTSAKTGENVDEIFQKLARNMIETETK